MMMMRALSLTVTFVGVLALTPVAPQAGQTPARPAPQQPGLTFRATANFVEVDAIVTDANGVPVADLSASDFEVSEDGRPQTLTVCSFVHIPIVRPDPPLFRNRIVEPDVVTNEKAFDGRVFMIVLDGHHVSTLRSAAVRSQAETFVDRYMGENDIATVVQIGNPSAGQEFTSNRRLLKAAISRFTGTALRSITATLNADAVRRNDEAAANLDPGPPRDTDAPVREFMARESLDSLRRLSEYMVALGGRRKALLFFSEGIGVDLMPQIQLVSGDQGLPPQPNIAELRNVQRAMVSAATRANVSIYTIDPRGLTSGMESTTLIGMTPAQPQAGGGLRDYSNPAIAVDAQNEERRMKESLREYAEQTGGLAMVDKNDMDAAFQRIVEDNSSYYVLGYQSPDPRHDGHFHRVSVRVKRPGLQVRTRTGYYAPTGAAARTEKTPDPVVRMLQAPAAIGGLGMRATASVVKGLLLKNAVVVTIEFNGKDLALKPEGQLLTNTIAVEYVAIDMKGTIQANAREDAQIRLEPKYHATFPQQGVRYVHEFELAPGRYQLRIAAQESLGGRRGSVFFDLDVPNLAGASPGMSDVLITSSHAHLTATGKSSPGFGSLLPTPPVTSRTFTPAETLTVLAAFYDKVEPRHSVDLRATVSSDTGVQVFRRDETRPSTDLDSAKGGYRWPVTLPLASFSPGRYVLTIEARSWLGDAPAVKKEVEFRVR